MESDTSVALDERLVNFSDFRVTETNFPTLPREQVKTVDRGDHRHDPDGTSA